MLRHWIDPQPNGLVAIHLDGPDEAASQLDWALRAQAQPFEWVRLVRQWDDAWAVHPWEWTHLAVVEGEVDDDIRNLLSLLETVVALPGAEPDLRTVLALDDYSRRLAHRPPVQWPRTEVGELHHQAKYEDSRAAAVRLADRLADVVEQHPRYRAATQVVAVPGHDPTSPGFGAMLAKAVAWRTHKPCVPCVATRWRPPAKGRRGAPPPPPDRIADDLRIEGDVRQQTVILVDDVYRTGGTLRAVAEAARRAGAGQVAGLVAARAGRGRMT